MLLYEKGKPLYKKAFGGRGGGGVQTLAQMVCCTFLSTSKWTFLDIWRGEGGGNLVRMVCNTDLVMNEIRHETNITMRPVTSGKMGPKCPSCLTGLQFHHQIISPIHVALETDWPSDWEGRTNDWTYSWRNLVCPKNWGAHFSAISIRKFDLLLLSVMYKWAQKRIW